MMSPKHYVLTAIAATLATGVMGLLASSTSDALGISADRGYNGLDRGYVVANSRHGNGRIAGRVRPTQLGPQVQLPSGHWEYCRRSCSETLRVETIDFYDTRDNGRLGIGRECGIFGCLDIHVGGREY